MVCGLGEYHRSRPDSNEVESRNYGFSRDRITIDAENNLLTVDLSEKELAERRAAWRMPQYKATRGTLAKYIRLVKSASVGCVTDEL